MSIKWNGLRSERIIRYGWIWGTQRTTAQHNPSLCDTYVVLFFNLIWFQISECSRTEIRTKDKEDWMLWTNSKDWWFCWFYSSCCIWMMSYLESKPQEHDSFFHKDQWNQWKKHLNVCTESKKPVKKKRTQTWLDGMKQSSTMSLHSSPGPSPSSLHSKKTQFMFTAAPFPSFSSAETKFLIIWHQSVKCTSPSLLHSWTSFRVQNNPISMETDVHLHDNIIDGRKQFEEEISCYHRVIRLSLRLQIWRRFRDSGSGSSVVSEVERQADHARRAARNNSKEREQNCIFSSGAGAWVQECFGNARERVRSV